MKHLVAVLVVVAMFSLNAGDISLPKAAKGSDKTLQEALSLRKTGRNFSSRELSAEKLSALLWAADGINRPDGKRTAPTGMNVQDIDIYVILPAAAYLYDPKTDLLKEVKAGDFREAAGRQDFVKKAPVNLIYVQNLDKAMKGDEATKARHGGIHTGAIMQNVYLFCAANELITVARYFVDRPAMTKILGLKNNQRIILAQTVGFPEEEN